MERVLYGLHDRNRGVNGTDPRPDDWDRGHDSPDRGIDGRDVGPYCLRCGIMAGRPTRPNCHVYFMLESSNPRTICGTLSCLGFSISGGGADRSPDIESTIAIAYEAAGLAIVSCDQSPVSVLR